MTVRPATLHLAQYFLQVASIRRFLWVVGLVLLFCIPVGNVHVDDVQPLLASTLFAACIIGGPLALIGASRCLIAMPVKPATVQAVHFHVLVLIALIGSIPLLAQAALWNHHLMLRGWPAPARTVGMVAAAPWWVFLVLVLTPLVRSRWRYVLLILVAVLGLTTPLLSDLLGALSALRLLPETRLGCGAALSGVIVGAAGLVAGTLWSIVLPRSRWGMGQLPWSARAPAAGSSLLLSAPLPRIARSPRARIILMRLCSSQVAWLSWGVAALVPALVAFWGREGMAGHTGPVRWEAWCGVFLVAVGCHAVLVLAPRIATAGMLSRERSVLLAIACGPLLIALSFLVAVCVWPLLPRPPAFTTVDQYMETVFPQATSVRLPDGTPMAIDTYIGRRGPRTPLPPAFARAQERRWERANDHLRLADLPEARQVTAEMAAVSAEEAAFIAANPPTITRDVAGHRTLSYPPRSPEQQRLTAELARHFSRLFSLETAQEQRIRQAVRWSGVLTLLAWSVGFLVVVALILPGRPRQLPWPAQRGLRAWLRQRCHAVVLARWLLALAAIGWLVAPFPAVRVPSDGSLPEVPFPWDDRLREIGVAHPLLSILALSVLVLGGVALVARRARRLPLA